MAIGANNEIIAVSVGGIISFFVWTAKKTDVSCSAGREVLARSPCQLLLKPASYAAEVPCSPLRSPLVLAHQVSLMLSPCPSKKAVYKLFPVYLVILCAFKTPGFKINRDQNVAQYRVEYCENIMMGV